MASDTEIAKLLTHIAACHTAVLPGARLPLYAGGQLIGYLTQANIARLMAVESGVVLAADRVDMDPALLPRLNELAAAMGIPIVANPPVARQLHKIPENQPIPEELFEVVAAILRWVSGIGTKVALTE